MELVPAQHATAHGQTLARGVLRLFYQLGFAALTEFVPARGLRVDVIAIGPKGEIWIVECKSCRNDFISDRKWQGYLDWCDRYYWAVDADFPDELLPSDTGLIKADAYGGEVIRAGAETKLAGPRRTKLTRDFARAAATRLLASANPDLRVNGFF